MEELVPHVIKKLCDAFRGLPNVMADEEKLRDQANFLAMAVEISRANHRASSRPGGTRRAIKQLAALANELASVAKRLGELPAEAQKALVEASGGYAKLSQFQREVLNFHRATSYAIGSLEAGVQSKALVGRRELKVAKDVTNLAAAVFESLTGKAVTRRERSGDTTDTPEEAGPYGPFHDFLTEVLRIFGIKAKADPMIRDLMAKTRSEKSPLTP